MAAAQHALAETGTSGCQPGTSDLQVAENREDDQDQDVDDVDMDRLMQEVQQVSDYLRRGVWCCVFHKGEAIVRRSRNVQTFCHQEC